MGLGHHWVIKPYSIKFLLQVIDGKSVLFSNVSVTLKSFFSFQSIFGFPGISNNQLLSLCAPHYSDVVTTFISQGNHNKYTVDYA